MKTETQTLSQLPIGTQARIERYLSTDPALRRFRELGLLPGSLIKVVRRAPLGDPIEIAVGASLLSIRQEQASLIAVMLEVAEGDSKTE